MTAVTTPLTGLPPGPWTADDLDDFPDDGLRYELVDGVLLVHPTPSVQHQRVARNLGRLLEDHAPPELEVFPLPLGVRSSPVREIQPDVLVVRREHATGRRLSGLPLLVVEVQSPSTRLIDQRLKRQVLQEAGVPSYWLVDPDAPALTALELRDGGYAEVARVEADQAWTARLPYPVTVVPAALLR